MAKNFFFNDNKIIFDLVSFFFILEMNIIHIINLKQLFKFITFYILINRNGFASHQLLKNKMRLVINIYPIYDKSQIYTKQFVIHLSNHILTKFDLYNILCYV